MNLVRHDLGLSEKKSRFPTKGTCLAIYSRVVNAEEPLGAVLGRVFRGVAHGNLNCAVSLPPTSRPSSASTVSMTTTCFSTGRK